MRLAAFNWACFWLNKWVKKPLRMCIYIIYLHINFTILKYFPHFHPIVDCFKDYSKVGNTKEWKRRTFMSGLCFLAYSVSSGAESSTCMHCRDEPDPLFFQVIDKNSLKKRKKKSRCRKVLIFLLWIFCNHSFIHSSFIDHSSRWLSQIKV